MKIIKKETEFGINVFLIEKDKTMSITFGGNGDLYWSINDNSKSDVWKNIIKSFYITKENYALFNLFQNLFIDMKKTLKEHKNKYDENHIELFDKKSNIITWYSDETAHEVSNFLKIKQNNDSFLIEFYTQASIKGYDQDFHTPRHIPIRFRNSGSRYSPFNIVFMKMYKDLKEIDDINDYGHQIHIEEYNYTRKIHKY